MDNMIVEVGTAWEDITPPLEVGLLTSSVSGTYERFLSVRSPLKAKVIVIKARSSLLAIVSLDLLGLTETVAGEWDRFKAFLSGSLPGGTIIITCTHTHSAPESVGLSALYESAPFEGWLAVVKQSIAAAISRAAESLQRCRVRLAITTLPGYSLQRRIEKNGHVVLSDSMQPIDEHLMEREPVDRRVHALRFIDLNDKALATVVQAVCHPVHEMCLPHVSADFPGDLCQTLEDSRETGIALFLNGAAGDINPTTVSMGADYAVAHGRALADVVRQATAHEVPLEGNVGCLSRKITLPVRADASWMSSPTVDAYMHVMALGPLAIVFVPGEPFIEVAMQIEHDCPFERTVVVAYAESSVGYLPTAAAFAQGGYETEIGRWSYLVPEAAGIIQQEAVAMAKQLLQVGQL